MHIDVYIYAYMYVDACIFAYIIHTQACIHNFPGYDASYEMDQMGCWAM